MRQAPAKLRELIEPIITGLGYEAVGIELLSQGGGELLRIYIDQAGGVTVDDCERVSHQVSGMLDVEDPISGEYTLEVSSPGIDRPLFRCEDFARFAGQRAKLRLRAPRAGRARYTALLRGVEGDEVLLEVEGEALRIAYDEIDQARLVGDPRSDRGHAGESGE
ncbi:MAG: ribosome maturation factor RimP [Gammaproteobacteria bacterium]|jgi:ribosome maturation factor RimP|nr:ribosome maturation factor RimP [Gammaproteobacteria bacterium]